MNNLENEMMRFFVWFMICVIMSVSVTCQPVDAQDETPARYPEKRYQLNNVNYRDFIVSNQQIWAVSEDGHLIRWDISNDHPKTEHDELNNVTCITKTATDDIYVGTNDGEILSFHPVEKSWKIEYSIPGPVYGVCRFDAASPYAITDQGILNVSSKVVFRPQYSMNSEMDYRKPTIGVPSSILCDSHQQIWIGYYQGEWGGDIHLFSTKNEAYLPITIDYEKILGEPLPIKKIPPISSIVEGESHTIYITSGLQHLVVDRYGSILQFREASSLRDKIRQMLKSSAPAYIGTPIFMSSTHRPTVSYIDPSGEYIGPASVNPYDHKLYYYSNYGFHVVEFSDDGHEILRKTFFHPKLEWIYGRRINGSNLSVLKFEFIDEHTLVFLTRFDGIGIFDGHEVKFYK